MPEGPLGGPRPFVKDLKTVVIAMDFTTTQDLNGLMRVVEDIADDIFGGEIAAVRLEDHAIEGREGIRVVYDTQINSVFKENVDKLEKEVSSMLTATDIPSQLHKMAITAESRDEDRLEGEWESAVEDIREEWRESFSDSFEE